MHLVINKKHTFTYRFCKAVWISFINQTLTFTHTPSWTGAIQCYVLEHTLELWTPTFT